jgi:hypothetical protein
MAARFRTILWLGFIMGVVVFFFHKTLFSGCSLVPTDILHQLVRPYNERVTNIAVQNHYNLDILLLDYGWGKFWQESVRAGELPLWNPYVYGGHPHFAVSMEAVLNPLNVLNLFLSVERAFSIRIVIEFILAGWLMFAFLRGIGRSVRISEESCQAFRK